MINLKTFIKNHFADKEISDDELQHFSEDHLARITASAHASLFEPILARTADAHMAYFGAISDEDVNTAIRVGMTLRVDDAIAAFKRTVQQKEGAIRSAFGTDGAKYQEFFPQGLEAYSHASKENVEQLMELIATAATNNAAALEPGLPDTFITLRDTYKELRAAQLGRKGKVSADKVRSKEMRTKLELRLMGNIHFIAWVFEDAPERTLSYFDQNLLRD